MTVVPRYALGVERIFAKSPHATTARALVEDLRTHFVARLQELSDEQGCQQSFERIDWLRDDGLHGGGDRYVSALTPVFNRAAVNVSGVHYDDLPNKRLASADALSTIIHPHNPHAPSAHMHFSWTELRSGEGYYRMMADLNPGIPNQADARSFEDALRAAAPEHYEKAAAQGDRYFHIPALDRHRGVSHFYLEGFSTRNFEADTATARKVAMAAIDVYIDILRRSLQRNPTASDEARAEQLAYHTAYLFQVLTLDRGTTSGLLVHGQNDLGIMGSLPSFIDRSLLASWEAKALPLQKPLVRALAQALPAQHPSAVDDDARLRLAQIVRSHYQQHPEALELQASGGIIPPTVANHKA